MHCGVYGALALAVALGGCAGSDFDASAWFAKPLVKTNLGYTYSQLDAAQKDRPITANDLVDANGACPARATPPAAPGQSPEAAPDGGSQLGGRVGIGMSECDVVARVGAPSAVSLSRNRNGDRTAVLTVDNGPRPGVYRFVAGRLSEMDELAQPPAPAPAPQPEKKKKSAKTKKPPPKKDDTKG
jgi:hypothetical protein